MLTTIILRNQANFYPRNGYCRAGGSDVALGMDTSTYANRKRASPNLTLADSFLSRS